MQNPPEKENASLGPASIRRLDPLSNASDTDLELLHKTGMATLRRTILRRMRAAAAQCREVEESRYHARQRLAGLSQIGRDIDRLATAGVIMLRDPGSGGG